MTYDPTSDKNVFNILVLSIEKHVSREIILSAHNSIRDYVVIGVSKKNRNPHSHLCDLFFHCSEEQCYEDLIIRICSKYGISFVVSGDIDDLILLAKIKSVLKEKGVSVPVCCPSTLNILYDKKNYGALFPNQEFYNFVNTFCLSETVAKNIHLDYPVIVKPKKGFRSIGVEILYHRSDFDKFVSCNNCEQFVVQPYLDNYNTDSKPGINIIEGHNIVHSQEMELSFQILIGVNKQIIGVFGSLNTLDSGIPVIVETIDANEYFEHISPITEKLIEIGFVGPVNIQGIRVSADKVVFFEINPRFTAMSSVRAELGFNELDILYDSFLLNMDSKFFFSKRGLIAHRYYKTDIINS